MQTNPKLTLFAGHLKRRDQLADAVRSAFNVLTFGSLRVPEFAGNPGDNEYIDFKGRGERGRSINSWGVPSKGLPYYKEHTPAMVEEAHEAGKEFVVSMQPDKPGDLGILTELSLSSGADYEEINGGCLNVWEGNGLIQKLAIGYLPEALKRAIGEVLDKTAKPHRLRIKLPPYIPIIPDPIAKVLDIPGIILVTPNTVGNCFMFRREDRRRAIEFGRGLGGGGGAMLLPIGLGQVEMLRYIFPQGRIVGGGGVQEGFDIWQFCQFDVEEVGIMSLVHFTNDWDAPSKLLAEFAEIISESPPQD